MRRERMKKMVVFAAALLGASTVGLAEVKTLNSKKEFNDVIKKEMVVVEFVKSGCTGCDLIKKEHAVENVSKEFPSVTFAEIDKSVGVTVSGEPLKGYPTFIFYKNGQEVGRKIGGSADFAPLLRGYVKQFLVNGGAGTKAQPKRMKKMEDEDDED